MTFAKDCPYFDGHFPELAILPAVAQLYVAERIAKSEFKVLGVFKALHQVKFKVLIQPDSKVRLNLEYNLISGVLSFSYNSSICHLSIYHTEGLLDGVGLLTFYIFTSISHIPIVFKLR